MTTPNQFYAGFAAAVAAIVRQHDEPTIAANVIAGYGIPIEEFDGVDEYDMQLIRPLYETENSFCDPENPQRELQACRFDHIDGQQYLPRRL